MRRFLLCLVFNTVLLTPACASGAPAETRGEGQQAFLQGRYEAALRTWLPASAAGDAQALCGLGNLHNFGLGVEMDVGKAAAYYRKAATGGHAEAQFRLARLYREGVGVEQDFDQALSLFKQSALQGYLPAVFELASMLPPSDAAPAAELPKARLMQFAADAGYTSALLEMGRWAPIAQTMHWLMLAARQEDPQALLAVCMESVGNAYTQDPERLAYVRNRDEEWRRAYLSCGALKRHQRDPYWINAPDTERIELYGIGQLNHIIDHLPPEQERELAPKVWFWKPEPRRLVAAIPPDIAAVIQALDADVMDNWSR